ncbi:MAG: oxidoreductase [Thaumarchaeota archaeon]|nr:oxidoreductase [Nitrososphaerota archaeon]
MRGEDKKIKLGVFKFSSCSGCQQQIIDLGEDLLSLTDKVEIAYFLEASSRTAPGPYDVALIEGSISTPHEVELIKKIREEARMIIAVGTCAVYGGIQAMRNWLDIEEVKAMVYNNPDWISALEKSRPISDYVRVDYAVSGCPVNKLQLLSALKQIIIDRKAYHRTESLCQECKRRGNVCVMVAKGIPCLGPVIKEGCGALCPSYSRGCYGCFGPSIDPKPDALAKRFEEIGLPKDEIVLKFRTITGWSEPFRRFLERYERE